MESLKCLGNVHFDNQLPGACEPAKMNHSCRRFAFLPSAF
jgi:hypothetical protein